jgi:hypothetical protein
VWPRAERRTAHAGEAVRLAFPIRRRRKADAVFEVRQEKMHVASVSAAKAARVYVIAEIDGNVQLLSCCRVVWCKDRGSLMRNMASRFVGMTFSRLDRRPALTAMMVYLASFGLAALIVTVAMRRESACTSNPQVSHHASMGLIARNRAGPSDPSGLPADISNRCIA